MSVLARGKLNIKFFILCLADDRFVAIGAGATFFSEDGQSWQREPNQDAPLAAAYGAKTFIGSNWKGRLFRSTDAIQWNQVHRSEQHVEAVCFGGTPLR